MKNDPDKQHNKNITAKTSTTENAKRTSRRPTRKKREALPQYRRVQLAFSLLTVIAVSLFILLVLIPRPDSQQQSEEGAERTKGPKSEASQPSSYPSGPGDTEPGSTESEPAETSPQPEYDLHKDDDSLVTTPPEIDEDTLSPRPLQDIDAPAPGAGRLYLVIDDVGYNLEQLDTYLHLPIPMTFALLPELEFTRAAQERIARSGDEMILHQPIEPMGEEDPGPGALYVGMPPEEMRRIVNENLEQLPGAIGVNNHMGSKGTADPELMEALFSVLKGRQLYFLDSRTTADTVGDAIAENLGVPFSERNVFLDNIEDPLEIERALSSALEVARTQGYAVMIGHVWSLELASTLSLWYGKIEDRGYEFVHLSLFFTEEHVHAGNGN